MLLYEINDLSSLGFGYRGMLKQKNKFKNSLSFKIKKNKCVLFALLFDMARFWKTIMDSSFWMGNNIADLEL